MRDERGSVVLVFAALFLPLLFVLSAVAFDFGIARVRADRMQTALDAAALAGSLASDRYADIAVHAYRYRSKTCTDTDEKGRVIRRYDCSWWEPVTFPLRRVLAQDAEAVGRREAEARQLRFDRVEEVRAWAELRPGNEPEAQAFAAYRVNAPWYGADTPQFTRAGANTLAAAGGGCWPTSFLRLFGVKRLCLHRTGDATAMPR